MVRIDTPLTAETLRQVRHELGLSQSQLARRLGVSVDAVQAWEQGLRPIPGIAVPALRYVAARVAREKREKGEADEAK